MLRMNIHKLLTPSTDTFVPLVAPRRLGRRVGRTNNRHSLTRIMASGKSNGL
jgi:hypothetical protein